MHKDWNSEHRNEYLIDFHLPRFTQISESHCGPATIQMLLANLGIEVSQEAIAEAGGAAGLIEMHGMRVDQLAQAVHVLAPQARFWYKDHCKLRELIELVAEYHYPVGVEWQGLFEGEGEEGVEDETGDDDYGHFSVVIQVNPVKETLVIADPYKDYIAQDRVFTFKQFKKRWYDFNEVTDPQTGQARIVEDYHMMFIITPGDENFPEWLEMKKAI